MNLSTIDNDQIYIHELSDPFERIAFQFVPDDIRWERVGNWSSIPIVGRNNSKKQLTGGEDRVSFQLDFNGMFEQDKRHCLQKMRFLQSLTVTDGFSGPARNVKIAWGDIFRFNVWVVKSVRANMSGFSSLNNYNPLQLILDVDFELDPAENQKLLDVRGIYINDTTPVRSINDFNQPSNIA